MSAQAYPQAAAATVAADLRRAVLWPLFGFTLAGALTAILGEAVKGFKKGMTDEDGKDKPAPRLPDANRTDEAAQRERERDNDQQPR